MELTRNPGRTAIAPSLTALAAGVGAIAPGRRVNYRDHMTLFSEIAVAAFLAASGALLAGLFGTWKSRGHSWRLGAADGLAVLILAWFVFTP
jgi:hypothetical protein